MDYSTPSIMSRKNSLIKAWWMIWRWYWVSNIQTLGILELGTVSFKKYNFPRIWGQSVPYFHKSALICIFVTCNYCYGIIAIVMAFRSAPLGAVWILRTPLSWFGRCWYCRNRLVWSVGLTLLAQSASAKGPHQILFLNLGFPYPTSTMS